MFTVQILRSRYFKIFAKKEILGPKCLRSIFSLSKFPLMSHRGRSRELHIENKPEYFLHFIVRLKGENEDYTWGYGKKPLDYPLS